MKQLARIEVVSMAERDKGIKVSQVHSLQSEQEYIKLIDTIRINPKDDSIVSISGANFFRILRYQDSHLKATFLNRLEVKV